MDIVVMDKLGQLQNSVDYYGGGHKVGSARCVYEAG